MSLRAVTTVFVLASLSGSAVRAQVFQELLSKPASGDSSASAIVATSDGGAVFAGHRYEGVAGYGCLLARIDAAGAVRWAKVYDLLGGGSSIRQTRDGGFIVAGAAYRFGGPSWDAFLLRVDVDGRPLWCSRYGSVAFDEKANAVVATADGGFAFAGHARNANGNDDAYVVRTDADGHVVWTRTYGGSGLDVARGLLATTGGGFLIVGNTDSSGAGSHDAFAIETDAAGTPLWSRTYGGAGVDQAYAAVEIAGGFAFAGASTSAGIGGYDVSLTVVDRLGNLVWSKTYDATLGELGTALVGTEDGGFTVTGSSADLSTNSRGLAVHTDAFGRLLWSKLYGGGRDASWLRAVTVAPQGGYWFAGVRNITGSWPGTTSSGPTNTATRPAG